MDNEMTYEQAIQRLEEIVATLENNEATLDDSLKLFEEGTKLSAFCSNMLKQAQTKITEINKE